MWAIKNTSPYAAAASWSRDKNGVHEWLVAVKATFVIDEYGRVSQADDQPAPFLAPEYHGDPAKTSLRFEADVVPTKRSTDVLFVGSAHAPRGRPVRKLPVSLRVGPVNKDLIVFGPRIYLRDGSLSAPVEFTTHPITYESAYGGTDLSDPDPRNQVMDRRNPVGKGIVGRHRQIADQIGHRIEYLTGNPSKMGPAGYGAIASHWSPRLELAGTYDQAWEETRKPLLPLDYDELHVQAAPADQRPPRCLRGRERVQLLNLCPWGTWQFDVLQVQTGAGRPRRRHHRWQGKRGQVERLGGGEGEGSIQFLQESRRDGRYRGDRNDNESGGSSGGRGGTRSRPGLRGSGTRTLTWPSTPLQRSA